VRFICENWKLLIIPWPSRLVTMKDDVKVTTNENDWFKKKTFQVIRLEWQYDKLDAESKIFEKYYMNDSS